MQLHLRNHQIQMSPRAVKYCCFGIVLLSMLLLPASPPAGMFMPHLLYNFIYSAPRKDCLWHRIKDAFVRFVSREVHCAATFCRR